MDQMSFIQKTQRIQQLLCKDANERCAQPAELILLDEFIKIDAEQFKGQAEMLSVDECIL